MLKLLLAVSLLQFFPAGLPYSDGKILSQFSENINRCGGNICNYEVPEIRDTKAPKGYKPFYISHYSRHGSRYLVTSDPFFIVDSLKVYSEKGWLTSRGDSLYAALRTVKAIHDEGFYGQLTARGAREQKGIGARLAKRYPEVFRTPARTVNLYATNRPRCIASMANFSSSLIAANPKLEYNYLTADKYLPLFAPRVSRKPTNERINPVMDSILNACDVSHFAKTVLADSASVCGRFTKGMTMGKLLYDCYFISLAAITVDDAPNTFGYFTPQELLACYKAHNLYACAFYGYVEGFLDAWPTQCGLPVAQLIIDEADKSIAEGRVCADFRFGHDNGIGPMMCIFGIDGNDKAVPAGSSAAYWPSWKAIPMATNLQLVFYRNKAGDILVKFLRNEEEVSIPELSSDTAPYYPWEDVKALVNSRKSR